MRLVAPVLLAISATLLGGCGHMAGNPPQPILRPSQVSDFATLYSQNCAACHGANGQGGPAMDLANPEYQALVDDASLRKWISSGMPGTEMAPFAESAGGMLTDAQVNALIAGMRAQWSHPNTFAGLTPPAYAQQNAGDPQRGQQAYQSHCMACHDASPQQITSPGYLTLVNDQVLRTIIIAGRPDIGHPDWQHDSPGGKPATPLTPQQVDDIVTYLASLRYPAQQPATTAATKPSAHDASSER